MDFRFPRGKSTHAMPVRDVFFKSPAFPMVPMIGAMGSLAIHAVFLLFVVFLHPSQPNLSPRGSTSVEEATVVIFAGSEVGRNRAPRLEPLKRARDHGTIPAGKDPQGDVSLPSKVSEGVPSDAGSLHTQSNPKGLGTADGDPNANPLERYLFGLRQAIESKKVYPSLSRRMGETGKVLVILKLLRDGTVQDVRLKGSSRYARLDQVALDAVSAVEKYRPIPASIPENELIVEVPIEFKL